MDWNVVAKYFIHGLAFSILTSLLVLLWAVILAFLILMGLFIGLIVGIGLLMLIVGFINSVVTGWLWFPVKSGFWNMLVHGFVLFIALLVVNAIVSWTPQQILPGIPTLVVAFIVTCFVDGYVGKWVASFWEEEEYLPEGETDEAYQSEWRKEKVQPKF